VGRKRPPDPAAATDPYFHRELTLRVGDRRFGLHASQELFSSHTIDTGTLRLVKSLADLPAGRALDLGCGYGPIAIALRARHPDAEVVAVDRDRLALHYTAANVERAGLAPVETQASLGLDDVGGDFDLVASNIPGKGAPGFHADLLATMLARLRPAGVAAVVVVNPLVPVVEALDAPIVLREAGAEHTVLHLQRGDAGWSDPGPAFERGVYDRAEVSFRVGSRTVRCTTVHGLAEFDVLGYHTELAFQVLERLVRPGARVVVVNPGQGHVAARIAGSGGGPASIVVVDRDLLALRTTARNLAGLGVGAQAVHGWDPPADPVDLAVLNLRPKEPVAVHHRQRDALLAALEAGGALVVAGTAVAVDRVVKGHRVRAEKRRRGHAAVVLEKDAARS